MATLAEIVTGKGYDASQGIIEEVSKLVPELDKFDSVLIPGTTFQSVAQTSDPTTGFRTAGNGIDASDEGYRLDDFALGILAGLCQRDKAVFDADVRGREAAFDAEAAAGEDQPYVPFGDLGAEACGQQYGFARGHGYGCVQQRIQIRPRRGGRAVLREPCSFVQFTDFYFHRCFL